MKRRLVGLLVLALSLLVLTVVSGQKQTRPFSKGATLLSPAVGNFIVWYADTACTVTNVRGYRVGGTGATVNARLNGASNHLAAAVSLAGADVGLTQDYGGRAVPNGHSPDIGAYESDQQISIAALMLRLREAAQTVLSEAHP